MSGILISRFYFQLTIQKQVEWVLHSVLRKRTFTQTVLLNDAFDVMNWRRWMERIHHGNWEEKKKHLADLIDAINETEAHSLESKYNGKPFLSDTSLKAMRLTLTSAMELTEFLLDKCMTLCSAENLIKIA